MQDLISAIEEGYNEITIRKKITEEMLMRGFETYPNSIELQLWNTKFNDLFKKETGETSKTKEEEEEKEIVLPKPPHTDPSNTATPKMGHDEAFGTPFQVDIQDHTENNLNQTTDTTHIQKTEQMQQVYETPKAQQHGEIIPIADLTPVIESPTILEMVDRVVQDTIRRRSQPRNSTPPQPRSPSRPSFSLGLSQDSDEDENCHNTSIITSAEVQDKEVETEQTEQDGKEEQTPEKILEKRQKREIIETEPLKSPYMRRTVNPRDNIFADETRISRAIFSMRKGHK